MHVIQWVCYENNTRLLGHSVDLNSSFIKLHSTLPKQFLNPHDIILQPLSDQQVQSIQAAERASLMAEVCREMTGLRATRNRRGLSWHGLFYKLVPDSFYCIYTCVSHTCRTWARRYPPPPTLSPTLATLEVCLETKKNFFNDIFLFGEGVLFQFFKC